MTASATETNDTARAKFAVGQLVRHLKFDYRGVVIDVDPTYQGSDEWYEEMAKSRPPKDRPWYHVLVDDADSTTYVAERHLAPDTDDAPVRHPMLDLYLADQRADGSYEPRVTLN